MPSVKATRPVKALPKSADKRLAKPVARVPSSATAAPIASAAAEVALPAKVPKVSKAAKSEGSERAPKPTKAPKPNQKPVRDSFTMPESDFALIAILKGRLLTAQRETKKSELLRAGLHALAALDTPALLKALGQLEPVKIGRPKRGH